MATKNVNSFLTTGFIDLNSASTSILALTPAGDLRRFAGAPLQFTTSGINITNATYRVNNVPYNTFTINFQHTSDTLSAGNNFFGNYATTTSTTRANRTMVVAEAATARKATWSQLLLTVGNPSLSSSGLFINATTNVTGLISSSINNTSLVLAANYYSDITPPVPVAAGDQIVCSIFCPTFATTFPAGVKNSVNVYFYN
jgi:hypothetical protein